MKICVPTENDEGLDALVSHHFGMAPYFAFVDSETKQTQFVLNGAPGHARGRCRAVDVVADHSPDAILTAEIGPGAFEELHAAGKVIYRTSDTRLSAALATLAAGGAPQITREEAVGHHGHAGHGTGMHRHHDGPSGFGHRAHGR